MKKIVFVALLAIVLLSFTPLPFYLWAQERNANFRLQDGSNPLVHGNQLVLISHGFDPGFLGKPVWPKNMRDAIAEHYLNNERNYVDITVVEDGDNLVSTCTFPDFAINTGDSGTILAILDWSEVANHIATKISSQEVAAAVIDSIITSQQGQTPRASKCEISTL